MSKVDRRRSAPGAPEAAGLNTLDWDGVTFTELPAKARHSDIAVLVAVVSHNNILAVAEAELPCRGPNRITRAALRTAFTYRQLSRWRTGVRMLLRDIYREDRGREG